MIYSPTFLLMALPGFALAMYASFLTKSRFNRYAKVAPSSGLTGAQAAYQMLRREGLHDVAIERVNGFLSDHYDPRKRVLRLSPQVHDGRSLSAVGVACHEAGHALQHARKYAPLALRSSLVPTAAVTSNLSSWILMLGLFLSFTAPGAGRGILLAGAALLSVSVLFTLVTLPVEWDASARAKKAMVTANIVNSAQADDAAKVLNAAFLTYLASAVSAVTTLLYWLMRAGVFGSRD